jgi:hypothetical protein
MNMSLMAIMRENPDMAKRLEQGTKEVRETKKTLMANASEYTEIYHKEIEEGTRQRQLLLENGKSLGKTEEEVLKEHGRFLPSRQTPIMNFLYFFMRDGGHPDWVGVHKELNKSYGHVNENVEKAVSEADLEEIYQFLVHEDEQYANVQEPEEMDKYIYGNMTHSMFVKIKKLKAFLAYSLAMKLCNKYGLEFDKVPCVVSNPNEAVEGAPWG